LIGNFLDRLDVAHAVRVPRVKYCDSERPRIIETLRRRHLCVLLIAHVARAQSHRTRRGRSMMSMGHRYTLVMASVTKWCLQSEMPPDMRLDFLSHLEKMVDGTLTPAVIALVEPIDKEGLELYSEAMKLGTDQIFSTPGRQPNAFDVLHQKFDVFAALNPSLRAAYDEACRPWKQSA
jgi:hypothetical protein